jgi:hypothetical protein
MGARRWSPAEETVLKEISESSVTLASQMHRLPGRTERAACTHACRVGIALSGDSSWSADEIRILKRIWRGDESCKSAVARLLPQRGYLAAKSEAIRIGIAGRVKRRGRVGYSWIAKACEVVLEDGKRRSSAQLAEIVGATHKATHTALDNARGRTFRVGEWVRLSTFGRYCGLWELGSGPDAERPVPTTDAQANKRARDRRMVREGRVNPFAVAMQQVGA